MATFDQIKAQVDARRNEAQELMARMRDRFAAIRSDKNLTDEGKTREIARTYRDSTRKIDTLRDQEAAILTQERTALERSLFGLSPDPRTDQVIAFRDAQDRADRVSSADEATRMLERALRSDDKLMVSALLERAAYESHDPRWARLFEQIPEADTNRQKIDDLTAIIREQSSDQLFFSGAAHYLHSKPVELATMTADEIEAATRA